MNLTNYHGHTLYCDGRASMDDFLRFAVAEHFSSFGFSSHAPLPFSTAWTMEWDRMEDYLAEFGLPLVMINYGVLGLLSMGYFLLVGGPVTGLTVGALLCLLCWCGLGSTPKNLLPIMLGFAGGAMLYVTSDEMIPETHAHGYQKQATYALLLGFMTLLLIEKFFG